MEFSTKSVIFTDCDGVLLDFDKGFKKWFRVNYPEKQFRYFHCRESTVMEYVETLEADHLDPIWSSIDAVREMHYDHGVNFIVISAIENYATKARWQNLKKFYGSSIKELHCIGGKLSKSHLLEHHKNEGFLWIEDHVGNAELGKNLGFDSVLIKHDNNSSYSGEIPVLNDMTEIKNYWLEKISLHH